MLLGRGNKISQKKKENQAIQETQKKCIKYENHINKEILKL